jgi:hypothetical protein
MTGCRCTAPASDLDGPLAGRCSHEHTECAIDACTLQELWNNYGIVGDLIVCCCACLCCCQVPDIVVNQPFTSNFAFGDIHELLSLDILHQLIKGAFKDHLVDWVFEYIGLAHPPAEAARILADIDHRYDSHLPLTIECHLTNDSIVAAPHFPGLWHFKHGRNFKQWTGDDSKALMKVHFIAIPMVQWFTILNS